MSILGHRVVRREDEQFLTVGGTYVDDLLLRDAAYVTYVRSTIAHARIVSMDLSRAHAAPGVLTVLTGDDVDLTPVTPRMPMINAAMARPWLAQAKVRFVGESVAAIVSETRAQG